MGNATDLLRQYLADRDVLCPECGYNLRGGAAAVCPECGSEFDLTVGAKTSPRRSRLVLLMLFAWLVALGGLELATSGRAAHQAYSRSSWSQQVVVLSTGPTNLRANVAVLPGTTRFSRSVTVQPGATSSAPREYAALEVPDETLQTRTQLNTAVTVAPQRTVSAALPAPAVYTIGPSSPWRNITAWQWAGLGVGAAVLIAAIVGLIVLAQTRRRALSMPMFRGLAAAACAGFAVYVGLQVARFVAA